MARDIAKNAPGAVRNLVGLELPDGSVGSVVEESIWTGLGMAGDIATNQVLSGGDFIHLGIDVAALALKGGIHLYRKHGLKKQLAQCLRDYRNERYLDVNENAAEPNATTWTTTQTFHDARFLFQVYKDIEQYVRDQNITEAELDTLGWRADVTIYASKKLPNMIQRLSQCCISSGVPDITKTDIEKRFNNVSFTHIGLIALTNAFIAEGERQKMREQAGLPDDHRLVPVLGRTLSLVAMCGIHEINLSDISKPPVVFVDDPY